MLQKLTAKQTECLEHALLCREKANAAPDPGDKAGWLRMADGWELLAKSYGLSFRFDDFLRSKRRKV